MAFARLVHIVHLILNATEYSTPSLVKDYARKAQFGQIFTFDKKTAGADLIFIVPQADLRGRFNSASLYKLVKFYRNLPSHIIC